MSSKTLLNKKVTLRGVFYHKCPIMKRKHHFFKENIGLSSQRNRARSARGQSENQGCVSAVIDNAKEEDRRALSSRYERGEPVGGLISGCERLGYYRDIPTVHGKRNAGQKSRFIFLRVEHDL